MSRLKIEGALLCVMGLVVFAYGLIWDSRLIEAAMKTMDYPAPWWLGVGFLALGSVLTLMGLFKAGKLVK